MRSINLSDAKSQFSRLIEDVQRGEEIVIVRAGCPVARLVPIARQPDESPRRPGLLRGRIEISDDFDAPLPAEVLADLEGKASGKR